MSKAEELKQKKIEELASALAESLGPAEGQAAAEFLRRYYASVAADDVLRPTRRHLIGAALSLWKLGERRKPGEAALRVVNPSPESEGWQSPHTVVEIVNDDMPFLVSSVTGALNRKNLTLHLVAHPVIPVVRDRDGRRTGIVSGDSAGAGAIAESYMHLELDQLTGEGEIEELRGRLLEVLADVRRAVADWQPMTERLREAIAELETHPPDLPEDRRREGLEFLRWLEGRFTFLGYREYALVEQGGETFLPLDPESGLGVLSEVRQASLERSRKALTPAAAANARRREPLFITKTYNRSNVHRPVHMDYVGVRRFGPGGEVVGERRFIGLFTAAVYDDSIGHIPLLREKVARVTARAGFDPTGHSARSLVHVFESLPRDELFQVTDEELYELALGVMRLQERQRLALFVRQDPFERFVSCLVYVPRDQFNTRLRRRMEEILSGAFAGPVRAFDVRIGDSPLARVHFVLRTRPGAVPAYEAQEIEGRLAEAARSWGDRLREELINAYGEAEGLELYQRYETGSLAAYREHFDPRMAVDDIARLEETAATGELQMRLYRPAGAPPERVNFKVYAAELRLLSDVLPMLENMGLEVISEVPYEVRATDRGTCYWLLDFELITADRAPVDLGATYERFQDAFARVWNGEVENDGFNRLVLTAGLTWREVVVLRAYARYLRQTGTAFSQAYIEGTLARNPEPARLLYELFAARFDPDARAEAPARIAALQARVRSALAAVSSLDEDRILRRYLNLIHCTLRTNYFQRDDDGAAKPYLAFKLDSRRVEKLPDPRPAFEVWIYSPRVEALHLRGGKVARGGIRWSDRPEDFRTEILGLMKAQMVKNAVIVPVGAKGGFIVKRPPAAGREERQAEGVECYRIMIRGLLDVTDNLVGGELAPPPRVMRHDDDDPYLVVAADKGTATFSDLANSVAAEYGFWLGDAFASGGSAGYDHKEMGITARGAWESVKRHFRELGHDVQSRPFTTVGVGDMSGDVFGNGMLLSPHTRLVGAFNHLHVFVDPDPDPAAGFAERKRLFDGRLGWNEYDPAALSAGGAIFERAAKEVKLSPEVRERIGLDAETVTPDELIRALLTAQVDLLWLGGIGTFVKATEESHAAVGDRFNDEARVDAAALSCRVVGEGANLGFTQRARIEYAMAGGRINTDAIDNSAGVDTSDHEVNIKIALARAIDRGVLDPAERNRLLEAMEDEVAGLVLRDNYLQTQALSVAESQGAAALDKQGRMMRELERAGRLDRRLEKLPDDDELAERQADGRGLTRPEIAVLLAHGKLWLYDQLLASPLPDDPERRDDLLLYFPEPLRERFREDLEQHRLRREIIATHVTNSMVNRVGPTFASRLGAETGASPAQIARAYTIARDSFDLRRVWNEIEALDNRVEAELQIRLIREVGRLVERATRWFLRHEADGTDTTARVAEFRPGARAVWRALGRVLPEAERRALAARAAGYRDRGVPEDLARWVAGVDLLAAVPDIVTIARDCAFTVEDVAKVYFTLGDRFALDWLRQQALRLAGDGDPWQAAAAAALVRELFTQQGAMTLGVLRPAAAGNGRPCGAQEAGAEAAGARGAGGGTAGAPAAGDEATGAEAASEAWLARHRGAIERIERLLDELRSAPEVDLARLTVASHQLRQLAEG
jgi:glutamate dehydrogenase